MKGHKHKLVLKGGGCPQTTSKFISAPTPISQQTPIASESGPHDLGSPLPKGDCGRLRPRDDEP